MNNDSDLLEIAMIQNMIRTIITSFEDRPQLVCYFYDDKNEPYYVLLIAISPFGECYSIFRPDNDITFKMRGNLLEIEEDTTEILALNHGKRVLRWLLNIRTAYLKVKIDYYLKEFL